VEGWRADGKQATELGEARNTEMKIVLMGGGVVGSKG